MTTANKTTLIALFETGDVPNGTQYATMINSSVNLAETAEQQMVGALSTTELIAARVSAGNINITGTFSAVNCSMNSIAASAAIFTQTSANYINVSSLAVTGDVSANSSMIHASAAKWSVGIVSAAGTAQAAGAPLIYTINTGMGVADGATTGFLIPANQRGRVQYIINGGASANLWPPVGGQINALASNAAFAMAANIPYFIIHTLASGYAVK